MILNFFDCCGDDTSWLLWNITWFTLIKKLDILDILYNISNISYTVEYHSKQIIKILIQLCDNSEINISIIINFIKS